jgi:hypothetical protein
LRNLYWHVYVRRATIFVPTVADTSSGYIDVEPTLVVPCGQWDRLRGFVRDVLATGNPSGSGYLRQEFPPPRAFAGSGVQSWTAFKKGTAAIGWSVADDACRIDFIEDMGARGRAGFEPVIVADFPPDAPAEDFVECVVQYVRQACHAQASQGG